MTAQPDHKAGTYALVLRCIAISDLKIGELGTLTAEPGYYVYTGSAFGPGGVAARLSRHIRTDKPPHWHIDYLRPFVQLEEVWYTHDSQRRECLWSGVLTSMKASTVPLVGFGASDCKEGCDAHLSFLPSSPPVATFRRRVRAMHPEHAVIRAVASLGKEPDQNALA